MARAKARRAVNVHYVHVTLLWLGRGTSGARSLFRDMVDYTCSVGPETIVQSLA